MDKGRHCNWPSGVRRVQQKDTGLLKGGEGPEEVGRNWAQEGGLLGGIRCNINRNVEDVSEGWGPLCSQMFLHRLFREMSIFWFQE